MPSRNELIVHRLYEALEARDDSSLFTLLSPRIRITHSPGLPWGGTFEGQAGAKVFLERVGSFVNAYVAIERILDAGDQLAVTGRTYGATRRTGRRFDVPFVHLWEFEDGHAVRLEIVLHLPTFQVALADAA
jgi:ketosteroid isomerase-like protein